MTIIVGRHKGVDFSYWWMPLLGGYGKGKAGRKDTDSVVGHNFENKVSHLISCVPGVRPPPPKHSTPIIFRRIIP